MKKLIPAALAGVLLVIGASVALAQTDDGDTTTTTVEQETEDAVRTRPDRTAAVQEVLDDLVADGTLTQEQADAVIAGLEARKAEAQAEREAVRAAWESAWADDVLTQDEAAGLADGGRFGVAIADPDGPLADYWADGELTRDELDEARAELGFGRRGHRHHGMGDSDGDVLETPEAEDSSFSTVGTVEESGA